MYLSNITGGRVLLYRSPHVVAAANYVSPRLDTNANTTLSDA